MSSSLTKSSPNLAISDNPAATPANLIRSFSSFDPVLGGSPSCGSPSSGVESFTVASTTCDTKVFNPETSPSANTLGFSCAAVAATTNNGIAWLIVSIVEGAVAFKSFISSFDASIIF